MKKKSLYLNLLACILSFGANMVISFIVPSYVVERVGSTAYGFTALANSFVGYTTVITVALNSMGSRFIAVSLHRGETELSNGYFSSLLFSNFTIAGVMAIAAAVVVWKLDSIIDIPTDMVKEIRWLFFFIFLNAIISICSNIFACCYYVKDKIYLSNLRSVEGNIIRVLVLFPLFAFLGTKVVYIGISLFVVTVYTLLFNIYYCRKLTPELKISRKKFSFKLIGELLSSGVWNSVNQLSNVLSTGLDLAICSIFINSEAMGILSLAKLIPNFLVTMNSSFNVIFAPKIVECYGKNDRAGMRASLIQADNVMSCVLTIPICIFIGFGQEFFSLWIPSRDAVLLQILSVLTLSATAVLVTVLPMNHIFIAKNKIVFPSVIALVSGCANIVIVYILLSTTNLGVFAVAGVSSVLSIIQAAFFLWPYAAKLIGEKWYFFHLPALRGTVSSVLLVAFCLFIRKWLPLNGWVSFFACCILVAILGLFLNFLIVIKNKDKKAIIDGAVIFAKNSFDKLCQKMKEIRNNH